VAWVRLNIVLPIKDIVNKRTLNFYRKISKSHRSSVYHKVLQIAKDENLPMVARANKLQEKYGLNAESCTEDWNKELETAVRRHRRQQNIRHSLAKKTCEDFLNVSSFHGQVKARDYVQFNSHRLDEIAAIHRWRAGHSDARSTRFIRHIEPDPNCTWCKQEETVEHILEHCPKNRIPREKLRTIARKYFEPREALIYQLVLESDKLEEERDQLTTRQKEKMDREIKNYVNIIIKTRKIPQEETQEEAQEENETTRPSTQEETRKRKRTEDQKPTKKHKKNHPVEA